MVLDKDDDCVLNLEEILALDTPRPEVMLHVNGKPMIFLCDSGACRTTCKEPIPNAKHTSQTVNVRAADGQLTTASEVGPVWIRDPQGKSIQMTVLSLSQCPVNLLGRDGLMGLGLALIPTNDRTIEVRRMTPQTDSFVMPGSGEPHYYYSLDLPNKAPLKTGTALIEQGKQAIAVRQDVMSPDQLHITMWFKGGSGPDQNYLKELQKFSPATITLTYLYSDAESTSVVGVDFSQELWKAYQGWTVPHVSLCKTRTEEWKDLGKMALCGQKAQDWVATSVNTWASASTGLTRKALFWTTKAKAEVHLQPDLP